MAKLGQFLIRQGLISPDQLEEALQHQTLYGARLGTNLIDLGMVTLPQLARALSDFHRIPMPPREWLARPSKRAIKMTSRALVERNRFVPMRADGKTLHCAVLDPHDPGVLDDLRFATGCRIQPYVLPEAAMHDVLTRLWKVPRGIRPVDISAKETTPTQDAAGHAANQPYDPREIDFDGWDQAPKATGRATQGSGPLPGFTPSETPPDPRQFARQPPGPLQQAVARVSATPERAKQARPAPPPPEPRNDDALQQRQARQNRPRGVGVFPNPRRTQSMPAPPVQSMPAPPVQAPPPVSTPPPIPAAAVSRLPPARARLQESHPAPADEPMPVTSNLAPQTPLPPVSDLSTSGTQPGLRPGESGVPDPMAPPAETGSDTEADTEAVAGPEAELPDTPPAPQPPEPHAPSTSTRPAASADTGTRTAKYGARMHLLELNLLEADDRESLIATALDIASVYADRVALFLVHQGTIQGVTCRSLGDEHAIDGVLVPLNAESMLSAAAQSEVAARVEPGAHPIDRRLLGLLDDGNSPQVPDAGIYPVSIRGRIVNLLYADNREARLAATSHGALIALAEIMAEGYERLILRRKGS